MKIRTLAYWVFGFFLTSQLSVTFAEPQPFADGISNIRITGQAEPEDIKPKFKIPLQFDVHPEGAFYSGRVECWRVRGLVFDRLFPDKYEGSTPIPPEPEEVKPDKNGKTPTPPKDVKKEKFGLNPRTGVAECAMYPYTDSSTEYYVKIAAGPLSEKSKEQFPGVEYPLYVTKKSYTDDKIYDGRTMQDCLANDVEKSQKWTDLSTNWTVEPIVTVQMARYTFRTHKTAINAQGAGIGITFKYYPDQMIIAAGDREEVYIETGEKDKEGNLVKGKDGKPVKEMYEKFAGHKDIRRIKSACRASSFDQTNKLAASLISIGPVVFVTKSDTGSDTNAQLGVILGFFENLFQIGIGSNVSPNKHMDPFLMIGFAKGFDLSGSSSSTPSSSKAAQ
jgi:hypothetical protein